MEENKSILIIKTEKNIIKCDSDSYFYITKENTIEHCPINEFNIKNNNNLFNNILFRARKSKKTGEFELINPVSIILPKKKNYIKNLENKLWYKIPDKEGYIINEGDIIKFGEKIYEIIKVKIFNKNINEFSNEKDDLSYRNKIIGNIFNYNIILNKNQYITEKYEKNKVIPNKFDKENPKINLCLCNNNDNDIKNDKFIFYKDLKQKINFNSRKIEKKYYITYNFNNFFCDKCGVHYPYKFIIDENIFYLFDIINPITSQNFLVLENLDNNDNNKNKIFHLIDEREKIIGNDIIGLNIGKENFNELILDKKNFILKNNSKIGTYVLIKDGIKINEKETHFQIGKINFTAKIEKNKDN